MNTTRLTELCNTARRKLAHIDKLLAQVAAQDAASGNAVQWLRNELGHRSYQGLTFELSMDAIFVELEEIDADRLLGDREDAG